jgi:hypothetical protein
MPILHSAENIHTHFLPGKEAAKWKDGQTLKLPISERMGLMVRDFTTQLKEKQVIIALKLKVHGPRLYIRMSK